MPRIPQVLHDPAPRGRRAAPGDFGSGAGLQAYSQASGAIAEASNVILETEMNARVSRALAGATEEIDNLRIKIESDPAYDGAEATFDKGRQEILNRFQKDLAFGKYKGDFETRITPHAERARVAVAQNVMQRRLNTAAAIGLEAHAKLVDQASKAADPDIRAAKLQESIRVIDDLVEQGALSPLVGARAKITSRRLLESADLLTESRKAANTIEGDHQGDLEAQFKAVRTYKLPNGKPASAELKDAIEIRLRSRFGDNERAEKESADALRSKYYTAIISGEEGFQTHEKLWERSKTEEWPSELHEFLQKTLGDHKAGTVKANSGSRYKQLLRMEVEKPEVFRKLEIAYLFGGELTPGHLTDIERRQREKGPELRVDPFGDKKDRGLRALGYSEGSTEEARFLAELQLLVTKKLSSPGRKHDLTPEEEDDLIARLVNDVTKEERRWRRDVKVPGIEITPQSVLEREGVYPNIWPVEKVEKQIREELGLGDDDDPDALRQIRDVYKQMLLARRYDVAADPYEGVYPEGMEGADSVLRPMHPWREWFPEQVE